MVGLISQASINNFSIDTVERAIVFSALVLQLAIGKTTNNEELLDEFSLKIEPNGTNNLNLKIDAYLPINASDYARYGGNIYRSLVEYQTDSFDIQQNLSLTVNPSTVQVPAMIDFPHSTFKATFETYLYFYSSVLLASIDNKRNEVVTIKPGVDSSGESVRVKVILPLNIEKWALGNNYIESVERIVTTNYKSWDASTLNFGTVSILDNNTILNNNVILTN